MARVCEKKERTSASIRELPANEQALMSDGVCGFLTGQGKEAENKSTHLALGTFYELRTQKLQKIQRRIAKKILHEKRLLQMLH